MEQQKVDMFMMMNNKYFPEAQIPFIRQHLLSVDESKGIGKLVTCGGLGIWTIIDLFLIMQATREKNLSRLLTLL